VRVEQIKVAAAKLRAARPTAVNLMWAIDRMLGDGTDLGVLRCGFMP
jgi:methylthioribose-1-phosphate isomerase